MSEEEKGKKVTISVNTLVAAAFALGLALGLSGGILISSNTGFTEDMGASSDNKRGAASDSEAENVFVSMAEKSGVDRQEFQQCFEESNNSEVEEDIANIQNLVGRIGTPTFLIGNKEIGYQAVSGAQPLSDHSKPNLLDDVREQIQEAENGDTTIGENETSLEGIDLEGEPSLGNSEAKIKVVEYSDYGCPYCAEWAGFDAIPRFPADSSKWFDKMKSEFVDTGQVQFIYKDYPVENLHPNSPTAHKAANCVLEQDKEAYWSFHDELYRSQNQWGK
jgi:Protein-disulfide isomerase